MPSIQSLRSRCTRLSGLLALSVATTTTSLVMATNPAAAVVPATPHFHVAAIEGFAPYQPQTLCDPTPKRGVVKFRHLVLSTYHGTGDLGITRACSVGGRSEHKEGRAWDWAVDVHNAHQVHQVHALFHWLFATDRFGNADANLRRLGIMYIIWNKRIWNASGWGGSGWSAYRCHGYTACHRNHVHFSFGWAGALARTSFWSGRVAPVIPPPARVLADSRLPKTLTVDPRTDITWTPWALTKGHTYRVVVTGTYQRTANPATVTDAECTLHSDGSWQPWPQFGVPTLLTKYDVTVNGQADWTTTDGSGQACDPITHTYSVTVTPRRTDRLRFAVRELVRTDDVGTLRVRIEKAPSTP